MQLLEQAKSPPAPTPSAPQTPTVRPFLSPAPVVVSTPATDAKVKNKHYLSAYQLLLSYVSESSDGSKHLVLGNLSPEFLESINSPTRIEGVKLFIAAFRTYRKGRIASDNYLDTLVHFPHCNRAMIALLFCFEFHNLPLDEEAELLSQRVSVLNFLPPPPSGQDGEYRDHVTRAK